MSASRYKIASLKAHQTTNTNELIVDVFELDDDGGSILYFDVRRRGGELSTGANYARFDTLAEAIQFASEEINGRLQGSY